MSDASFREDIRKSVHSEFLSENMLNQFHYQTGRYTELSDYVRLKERLAKLSAEHGTGERFIFYLSIPPSLYVTVIENLVKAGLVSRKKNKDRWSSVVIEKPFGRDLASAQELSRAISKSLSEDQIYRIDHFLGKETVQNILLFRFANSIFEPIWNREHIDHVQITAAEELGIEHRAGYYDQAGALRDMFQNHILQLIALTAMEPPRDMKAESIRNARVQVIRSLRSFHGNQISKTVVRGQYAAGEVSGQRTPAYRDEEGIRRDSRTETFSAMKLFVDNKRWKGVPFYCRSGKRLAQKITEIAIQFKRPQKFLFKPLIQPEDVAANVLSFRIQPAEGISVCFQAKQPGPKFCMNSLSLNFDYKEAFGINPPEAYERLLLDCMLGDQTLFTRQDDVELSWRFFQPVLKYWSSHAPNDFPNYAPGSWGPKAADDLIERDGRTWRNFESDAALEA